MLQQVCYTYNSFERFNHKAALVEMTQVPLSQDMPQGVLPPARPRLKYRTARTVLALMLREMSTSYGRSPGGYLWAVLQPISVVVIFALGFSLMLKAPSLGTNFILFYATGVLPLRMFQEVSAATGAAIQFNQALMVYPRVTFVDTLLARSLLALLTQIMVNCVVLSAIFLFSTVREGIDFVPVLEAYALGLFLALGIGTFNCYMSFAFPLWKMAWNIATRPLLLISGVFFIYEDLPRIAQQVLWFNPLLHVTGLNRAGFYSTYEPSYISIPFLLILGTLPLFFGMLLLFRHHKDALNK